MHSYSLDNSKASFRKLHTTVRWLRHKKDIEILEQIPGQATIMIPDLNIPKYAYENEDLQYH